MILAVMLLVTVLLAVNWYYYRLTRERLGRDFSLRLVTLASLASHELEAARFADDEPALPAPAVPDTLRARLEALSNTFDLANILAVREDGTTLLALHPDLFPPGELYPHWSMDFPAIIAALEGTPSATSIYRAPDGTFMMAGYAPLPPHAASAGAVAAVEASADFLGGLGELRTVLIVATTLSIIGVALFTWFVLKATSSLVRARESLLRHETLSSMGRMAAGIAHEIRNPLFIIRSSAEKLKETNPDRAGEIDGFIIEEVDRLDGILTDYLLFARDEPMRREELDLVTTLRRCVRLMRESIEEAGISLIERYTIPEAPFRGEEKKLQQAFLNILLNAAHATPESGTITITIARPDDHYRIDFTDTGGGIPAREREKIFEPFYTTKPTGSGLGLAVVRRIIEDHGGDVSVMSRTGAGTTVTVRLPESAHNGRGE